MRQLVPLSALPNTREVAAFALAFVGAGLLATVAFDVTRGPRWWTAPLIGSLVAAFIYTFVFYPVAYAGTDASWVGHMIVHGGILAGAAFAVLVPYWVLRGTVQPLSGFGGY